MNIFSVILQSLEVVVGFPTHWFLYIYTYTYIYIYIWLTVVDHLEKATGNDSPA